MNHRIFERTLRPLVFRGACLFERHYTNQALLGIRSLRPRSFTDGGAGLKPFGGVSSTLGVAEFLKRQERWAFSREKPAVERPHLFSKVDLGSGRNTR